jgi:hypothetical protein
MNRSKQMWTSDANRRVCYPRFRACPTHDALKNQHRLAIRAAGPRHSTRFPAPDINLDLELNGPVRFGGSRGVGCIYRNIDVVSSIARQRKNPQNGYHERSRDELGLRMDSTEALPHKVAIYKNIGKCLKQEGLECGGQGRNRTADASLFRDV